MQRKGLAELYLSMLSQTTEGRKKNGSQQNKGAFIHIIDLNLPQAKAY